MDKYARLKEAAGPDNVSAAPAARLAFASDSTGRFYPPEVIVRVVSLEQLSRVLAACQALRLPVVPRGSGSGMSGGALAVKGGVMLDLAGFNKIISIDQQAAQVQAGVITGQLQAAAEVRGLFYPPDPSSAGYSTMGGNLAENAGGLRALKYGVTRDYVLGLTAVLIDGRIVRTGSRTMKSVAGYDLTRLLVGSEGTLAVIAEATVKLLPLPEAKATLGASYSRLEQAGQAIEQLLACPIRLASLEFMDQATIRVINDYAPESLPAEAEAFLLVEVDGPLEVTRRQGLKLLEMLQASGAAAVTLARNKAEADSLWKARRAASPAMFKVAPHKLNEDVVVPLGRVIDLVRQASIISQRRNVPIVCFGHAGDGNIHVNVMYHADREQENARAHEAVREVFAQVLHMGGSISGEHGIGLTKLPYLSAELDPNALSLMQAIKKVFDPLNLLNPGKAVPAL